MKTDRIKNLKSISEEIARKKNQKLFQMLSTSTEVKLDEFLESFENGMRYNMKNLPKTNRNGSNFQFHTKDDVDTESKSKNENTSVFDGGFHDDFSELEANDYILCEFEVGLRENHPFTEAEISTIYRHWMHGILQDYFKQPRYAPKNEETSKQMEKDVQNAIKELSDSTLKEFRQKMYEKKYWHHIEEAHYDYRKYFVSLLMAYFKNKKPSSQIAENVDFEKLFSAKALQELRKAFTTNQNHFDNYGC